MRRSRVELMLEIMDAIRLGGRTISNLVYDVRANYVLVRKYLDLLEAKGLIESKPIRGRINFFLTKKGEEILRRFSDQDVLRFLEREPIERDFERRAEEGLRGM